MQTEPAGRRRQTARGRRAESGQSRAEPRGTRERAGRSSGEEVNRLKEIITMQQRQKQEEEEEEQDRGGRDRSRGDGGQRRGRAASEGGEGGERSGGLRWRVHQLEREKLELTSSHNQEVCRLQAESTRLRAAVERGEAQRVELQYQLTVSRRDAERAAEEGGEKDMLTARLQQSLLELQKALDITRQGRAEDQHALQQDVEERDRLIQNLGEENQRLHRLLQEHEEALEESERRMKELQKEREREEEVKRRQAEELKYLTEREERSRREREASNQRLRCVESSIEAERAAHLESKFSCEVIQLRARDLEAALASERSARQEAQRHLELLGGQLREERERSVCTERAQERLQEQYEQCKSDLSVALETERKTTSDLTGRLEEERRRHADTHTLLEEAAARRGEAEEAFRKFVTHVRDTLQLHNDDTAKGDGKQSPSAEVLQLLKTTLDSCQQRQETTDRQVQDLLLASERLQEENLSLRQLTSDQSRRVEESQQEATRLEEEVTRLRKESSDWSARSRGLQEEMEEMKRNEEQREREREKEKEREKEEMENEKEEKEREMEREKEAMEREKEEKEREMEREKEAMEREKEERTAELQKITEHYQQESEARLSFLYRVYQRLLAGCVLLDQPQSILGNFTWQELCDVISEQVDQLTSDLRKANNKIAHLQSVCEKKSACVRELESVLCRLEQAWSRQHTHTVTQLQNELQVCRSECASLRARASSLTSELGRSRGESSSFLSACALLGGALRHAHRRLLSLRGQKEHLCRRLQEKEALEEEVRRLAAALGGDEDEEEEEEKGRERRRRAVRRWRRSVCVVTAVRRWRALTNQTTVLLRLQGGGGACVLDDDDDDEGGGGGGGVCARWLRSKRLSSVILSSTADLQGALTHTGSAPPDVMSASRSALSRLLDHLLDQSDEASRPPPRKPEEDTPPRADTRALVSTLQQHFLLFSQRLHSAEVERRSLRLEVANLKRGLRQEREESCRTVPAERFHRVCVELRQALSREQEAQTLIQDQCEQLQALKLRADTHTSQHADTRHTLGRIQQALSEARQEASRKERSLRILGKHLSGVQREKRQLEEKVRRAEEELRDAARHKDQLISSMRAAETTYKEIRESLVQSRGSLSALPRPPLLPREHLELSGAESIMGAPELAACQSLLAVFAHLYHACSSRIDWLEQEVSAHRSHVTALRGELQDVCLRDNLAFVPVAEFPETFPLEAPQKELPITLSPAPTQIDPAPSPPLLKPPRTEMKEKKAVKKNRGRR